MSQLQRKYIADFAVDGTKFRLNNDQSALARNAANDDNIALFKLNTSDRLVFEALPQVTSDPVAGNDLVRLSYLNSALEGLNPKEAVRAISTTNVAIATGLENLDVVDGVTLATGDRVLLVGQTDPIENGIYIVAATGAASRAPDMDASSEFPGAYTVAREGTANAGKAYVCNSPDSFVMGTNSATFVLFKSAATLTGHDMITISGDQISVDLAAVSGLESSNPGNAGGQLRVKLEAANPSLQIDGTNQLGAKLDASRAITKNASGLGVNIAADGGLQIDTNALEVKLEATNPSLQIDGSNQLGAKLDAAGAIESGASGLAVQLAAAGGLEISSNDIQINVDATNSTTKINASNELESTKKIEQQFTLDGTDITNQYIDLSHAARSADSISVTPIGGLKTDRGVDFTVSLTGGAGGVTRITFAGDLATAGATALESGEKVVVGFEYL